MGSYEHTGRWTGVSRRAFLKSAAAGAAAVAAPKVLASGTAGREPLRLALLGAGAQGRRLLMDCLKVPGVRFAAVCDIWDRNRDYAVRLLGKYRQEAGAYEDYRQMLAARDDLDAVLIATPDWVHAEQTIACLEAGLDVYCEKEMSNSVAEARRMVAAARRTGRRLQVGHQRRSNPRYIRARKLVAETCVSVLAANEALAEKRQIALGAADFETVTDV